MTRIDALRKALALVDELHTLQAEEDIVGDVWASENTFTYHLRGVREQIAAELAQEEAKLKRAWWQSIEARPI